MAENNFIEDSEHKVTTGVQECTSGSIEAGSDAKAALSSSAATGYSRALASGQESSSRGANTRV